MIDLKEMQFELLKSEFDDSGYAFGIGLDVSVNEEGFDPGELTFLGSDSQNQHTGNRDFGRSVPAAGAWLWQLHTDGEDTKTALAARAAFFKAWKNPLLAEPGTVIPLRYRVGDRVRRVYGRPSRAAGAPSNRILDGYIPITAQFDLHTDLIFADAESSEVLEYNADGDGGFILPSVLPILTQPVSERARDVYNDGDEDAPLVVRFNGPIINPSLQGPGWNIRLKMEIPDGEYVEIDTRPWRYTILRNGAASVAGRFSRRQSLTDIKLPPGRSTLRYSGASSSATSTCAVHWRSAYSSL